MNKEIEDWVHSQNLDFDIAKINLHNTYNDRWRVDVYSVEEGQFVRQFKISKSYFVQHNDSGVTDLSINA